MLHLKSGVTAIGESLFVATPNFSELSEIRSMGEVFTVPFNELKAANLLSVNRHILIPPNCHQAKSFIKTRCPQKEILEVDTSEFAKLDGAPTCMSLVW